MVGRTLSHFRIVARIGEGGMGVVYRAEDEKLHRSVALKVLPPEAVADEERRLRFLREARAAASLAHPNIATIYEVDEADGVVFIAMEFIEGRTLRSIIAGKPLPVRDALRFGIEITEGLARAHQARIVHRDLKPENVMVAADGHLKILDFGLAKLLERGAGLTADEASRLETISGEMTKQGRILGTAAYMSPEQARGQSVDNRSDLFAFGIVLYEMVTGKVPFHGPTPMDTLSAVLSQPVVSAAHLSAEVPPELERILGKCLEKDPSERYQDTRDLVVDLKRLKRDSESQPLTRALPGPVPAAPAVTGTRRVRAALLVTGTVALLVSLAWLGWRFWPRPRQPTEVLRQRQVFSDPGPGIRSTVSISPDGKYLAIASSSGLSVRHLETGEIRRLAMPEGQTPQEASWASDGTKLLVTSTDTSGKYSIWSVPLLTGVPRLLRSDGFGISPSPDGSLLLFGVIVKDYAELWVMDAQGGSPRRLFAPAREEWLTGAAWAPNSRRIAYELARTSRERGLEGIIESRDWKGGPASTILSDPRLAPYFGEGVGLLWLPDGRLLFSMNEALPGTADANIWSLRVDPDTGKSTGVSERITNWAGARAGPAGTTADGRQLLVIKDQAQSDVWVGDLERMGTRLSSTRRLTFDSHNDRPSFWMPDSRRIAFISDRNGSSDLLIQDLQGGDVLPLVAGPGEVWEGVLTPQKTSFLFYETSSNEVHPREGTLKRADLSGGSIESLLKMRWAGTGGGCPTHPTAFCLLSEVEEKDVIFYAFDLTKGKGKSVARVPVRKTAFFRWALSPDGSQVAFIDEIGAGQGIRILTLPAGGVREIPLAEGRVLQSIVWAVDGRWLFVTGLSNTTLKWTIFRTDLDGSTQVLLESRQREWLGNANPSPDGHHLAYQSIDFLRDYWILEGF